MDFFRTLNEIAFYLSFVLWAGGGVTVSVFLLPLRDPNTTPQVQGFLYSLWENLRIVAIAVSIIMLGTSLTRLIIDPAVNVFWTVVYFVTFSLTVFSRYMADRLIKMGASDPRSMLEVEKRNFALYLSYSDACIVLTVIATTLM
ncbi:conserved membrane protein of unknown function [Mesotoga infera]|uniref:DUF4149 domain-containing protein n=1 Tax=Mesotoga infera TaxID=1236046 RepID=A0A7Z7LD68_9BACT|nr:hypothetical protein [Mesotoga infera]SSC11899.1 conserved membrane protein of unknown function [Mesotoga infera]